MRVDTGERRNRAARAGAALMLFAAVWSIYADRLSGWQAVAAGQSSGTARHVFEVASVKPSNGDSRVSMMAPTAGGRFTATGVPLFLLILFAFRVEEIQLLGLPDWTRNERFDVVAKGEPNATPDAMVGMVESLLNERFNLRSHRETRELPAYDLIVTRSDGRLGPDLKRAETDCAALNASGRDGRSGPTGRGAAAPLSPLESGPLPPCMTTMGPGLLRSGGMSLEALARNLTRQVGRIVRNRTGLNEDYELRLAFQPQLPISGRADLALVSPDAPNLFTALQEQLGLKLESVRAPVDVIVIDNIERPTPD